MVPHRLYFSFIHDYDLVCMLNRRNPLGNNNFCYPFKFFPECLLNLGISSHIHSTSRIIKDDDFWRFQQSPGNGQALFLPSGKVLPALLYPVV